MCHAGPVCIPQQLVFHVPGCLQRLNLICQILNTCPGCPEVLFDGKRTKSFRCQVRIQDLIQLPRHPQGAAQQPGPLGGAAIFKQTGDFR